MRLAHSQQVEVGPVKDHQSHCGPLDKFFLDLDCHRVHAHATDILLPSLYQREGVMSILRIGGALIAAAFAVCASQGGAQAEVARIEIASRVDVLGGKPFGDRGPYEKIVGKIFFSLDPEHPRNKAIVDLDKAARDPAGRVTFSADLYVLAPKDPAQGNGTALFDILNRGRKNIIRDFNRTSQVNDPTTEADFGDGFLMRQGYTLVWVGWQFDIPRRDGLMALDAPPVLDQGKPITGRVSTTFTPNTADPTYPLDDMGRYADTTRYPPLDPASAASMLTVRDGFIGAPRTIPREQAVRPAEGRPGGRRHLRLVSQGRLPGRPFL